MTDQPAQATLLPLAVDPLDTDEAYTPAWVFDAMGVTFDLDVAAPPGGGPLVPSRRFYTAADDGLACQWSGVVWCNPPYGRFRPWAERWAGHPTGALMGVYAPETYTTALVFGAADCVAFCSPRFSRPDGSTMKPRHGVYVAFRGMGTDPAERLAAADRFGAVLYGRA